MPFQDKILRTLSLLWQELVAEDIPDAIIQQAIIDNSWFTPFYIQKSIENISFWYEKKEAHDFLADYSFPTEEKNQAIGIIAAGNVPLVAWHDILMVVLSGNVAIVKLSHQDRILIPYIVDKWIKYLPEIQNRIVFVPKIENVSALIATGSNATALQIGMMFAHIPGLIRKNRFSVAIWEGESEEEAEKLCEDILLYNGLGCRNVSNLLVAREKDLETLIFALKNYPSNRLSANYLQKVQYEKARFSILNQPFIDAKNALLMISGSLQSTNLGVINVVISPNPQSFLKGENTDLQCIVGKEIHFGQSQSPRLSDFADGIDTLKWLHQL